jgi:predicted nucleic acid-binding protein
MVTNPALMNPDCVVADASMMISLRAREPGSYASTQAQMADDANHGCRFYAPGVIVSETLYGLRRKRSEGSLTAIEHEQAVQSFLAFLAILSPPSNGDRSLVARGEALRSGYGRSRSADRLYIALAEELARDPITEIVTLDESLPNRASRNAPSINVRLILARSAA